MGNVRKPIQAVDLVVDEESGVLAVQAEADIDLSMAGKSKKHVHTTAGTAELVEGNTAFDNGATLFVTGMDTYFAAGLTKAEAEANGQIPAGIPVRVKLAADSNDIYVDASGDGTVSFIQVK